MSKIGELMRSAANELSSYILSENERLLHSKSSRSLDDPEFNDYQTCRELQKASIIIDALMSETEENDSESYRNM